MPLIARLDNRLLRFLPEIIRVSIRFAHTCCFLVSNYQAKRLQTGGPAKKDGSKSDLRRIEQLDSRVAAHRLLKIFTDIVR